MHFLSNYNLPRVNLGNPYRGSPGHYVNFS